MCKELEYYWGGDIKADPTTMSERKVRLVDKMRRSVTKVQHKDGKSSIELVFSVGKSELCEKIYLAVIGVNASTMWNKVKHKLVWLKENGNNLSEEDVAEIEAWTKCNKDPSERTKKVKQDHAIAFIRNFALLYGSTSPYPGEENLKVLPFENIKQLYDEYYALCKTDAVRNVLQAGREWFRQAWKKLYALKEVKFTRGKNTFPTCDICNNCNDMLALSRSVRYSRRQREIIFKVPLSPYRFSFPPVSSLPSPRILFHRSSFYSLPI